MKYKDYSKQIWNDIEQTLKSVSSQKKLVAAFDADGTLWDTDLGENFFHYLIDNKLVDLPENPWDHYVELKKKNPNDAYLWLAQICAGHTLDQVQKWAHEALQSIKPVPFFEEQKKLISILLKQNVEIFVITASVSWAVQAGMEIFGLQYENVLGVETKVINGIVTTEQNGVITYKQGKVDALLARTGGINAFFASGNTEGDLALLESATSLRLAVSAASRDDRLFKTESFLQKYAAEKNWLHHRFIQDGNT